MTYRSDLKCVVPHLRKTKAGRRKHPCGRRDKILVCKRCQTPMCPKHQREHQCTGEYLGKH